MNEPIIICPSHNSGIKLTELLAAPLIEARRRQCEQKFVQKEANPLPTLRPSFTSGTTPWQQLPGEKYGRNLNLNRLRWEEIE